MRFDQSLAGLATALCFTFLAAQSAFAQTVFINEIHYDNSGADTGEAIEVAGPAGTDLTGWSIALYNGSASQLNVYGTIALTGTFADQENGFGTLSFSRAGIQNGSPDGMALIDASSAIIQFLSYEGTFTAGSGPASGLTSTNIDVAESSGTAVGNSLQLTGTGSAGSDFSWAAAQADTFGAVNNGQTFGGGEPGTPMLVINEIDYDQPGADAAEFIEIRNNGSSPVDMAGWTLELVNGNGGSVYNTVDLSGNMLVAGD